MATPLGIAGDVEDSEKKELSILGGEETIAINILTLLFSKTEEKTSRRHKSRVYD